MGWMTSQCFKILPFATRKISTTALLESEINGSNPVIYTGGGSTMF